MRKALLQFKQRICYGLLICKGNVTPHRVWARGNTGHLPQSPSAGFERWSILPIFINQASREGGCKKLRNVADPGTQLIVLRRIHFADFGADFLEPRYVVTGQ